MHGRAPDHAEHAGTKENGLATQSRSFFWRQTVLIKARLQSPNDLSLSILIRMNLDVIAAKPAARRQAPFDERQAAVLSTV